MWDTQEIAKWIKALCELEDGLSEWEVNFVEDISHKDVFTLTDKQLTKLQELYEKHC